VQQYVPGSALYTSPTSNLLLSAKVHYDKSKGRSYSQVAEEVAAAAVASLQQSLVTQGVEYSRGGGAYTVVNGQVTGIAGGAGAAAAAPGGGGGGGVGLLSSSQEGQQLVQEKQEHHHHHHDSRRNHQPQQQQQGQPLLIRVECVTLPGCVELIVWAWRAAEGPASNVLQGKGGLFS
jgi:hypothetical protein